MRSAPPSPARTRSFAYAMKANSNQAVLTTLAKLGRGHGRRQRGGTEPRAAAGVPGERIIFSGVGKTQAEMNLGLDRENLSASTSNRSRNWRRYQPSASARDTRRSDRHPRQPRRRRQTHAKIATGMSENKFGVPISRAREVYA